MRSDRTQEIVERRENWPERNGGALIDHSVGLAVSEGHKELQDNVEKESYLPNNVQYEEVLGQSPEETKLHGSEEGWVHCP